MTLGGEGQVGVKKREVPCDGMSCESTVSVLSPTRISQSAAVEFFTPAMGCSYIQGSTVQGFQLGQKTPTNSQMLTYKLPTRVLHSSRVNLSPFLAPIMGCSVEASPRMEL